MVGGGGGGGGGGSGGGGGEEIARERIFVLVISRNRKSCLHRNMSILYRFYTTF